MYSPSNNNVHLLDHLTSDMNVAIRAMPTANAGATAAVLDEALLSLLDPLPDELPPEVVLPVLVPAGVPIVPVVSVAGGVVKGTLVVPEPPAFDDSAAKPTDGVGSVR